MKQRNYKNFLDMKCPECACDLMQAHDRRYNCTACPYTIGVSIFISERRRQKLKYGIKIQRPKISRMQHAEDNYFNDPDL